MPITLTLKVSQTSPDRISVTEKICPLTFPEQDPKALVTACFSTSASTPSADSPPGLPSVSPRSLLASRSAPLQEKLGFHQKAEDNNRVRNKSSVITGRKHGEEIREIKEHISTSLSTCLRGPGLEHALKEGMRMQCVCQQIVSMCFELAWMFRGKCK